MLEQRRIYRDMRKPEALGSSLETPKLGVSTETASPSPSSVPEALRVLGVRMQVVEDLHRKVHDVEAHLAALRLRQDLSSSPALADEIRTAEKSLGVLRKTQAKAERLLMEQTKEGDCLAWAKEHRVDMTSVAALQRAYDRGLFEKAPSSSFGRETLDLAGKRAYALRQLMETGANLQGKEVVYQKKNGKPGAPGAVFHAFQQAEGGKPEGVQLKKGGLIFFIPFEQIVAVGKKEIAPLADEMLARRERITDSKARASEAPVAEPSVESSVVPEPVQSRASAEEVLAEPEKAQGFGFMKKATGIISRMREKASALMKKVKGAGKIIKNPKRRNAAAGALLAFGNGMVAANTTSPEFPSNPNTQYYTVASPGCDDASQGACEWTTYKRQSSGEFAFEQRISAIPEEEVPQEDAEEDFGDSLEMYPNPNSREEDPSFSAVFAPAYMSDTQDAGLALAIENTAPKRQLLYSSVQSQLEKDAAILAKNLVENEKTAPFFKQLFEKFLAKKKSVIEGLADQGYSFDDTRLSDDQSQALELVFYKEKQEHILSFPLGEHKNALKEWYARQVLTVSSQVASSGETTPPQRTLTLSSSAQSVVIHRDRTFSWAYKKLGLPGSYHDLADQGYDLSVWPGDALVYDPETGTLSLFDENNNPRFGPVVLRGALEKVAQADAPPDSYAPLVAAEETGTSIREIILGPHTVSSVWAACKSLGLDPHEVWRTLGKKVSGLIADVGDVLAYYPDTGQVTFTKKGVTKPVLDVTDSAFVSADPLGRDTVPSSSEQAASDPGAPEGAAPGAEAAEPDKGFSERGELEIKGADLDIAEASDVAVDPNIITQSIELSQYLLDRFGPEWLPKNMYIFLSPILTQNGLESLQVEDKVSIDNHNLFITRDGVTYAISLQPEASRKHRFVPDDTTHMTPEYLDTLLAGPEKVPGLLGDMLADAVQKARIEERMQAAREKLNAISSQLLLANLDLWLKERKIKGEKQRLLVEKQRFADTHTHKSQPVSPWRFSVENPQVLEALSDSISSRWSLPDFSGVSETLKKSWTSTVNGVAKYQREVLLASGLLGLLGVWGRIRRRHALENVNNSMQETRTRESLRKWLSNIFKKNTDTSGKIKLHALPADDPMRQDLTFEEEQLEWTGSEAFFDALWREKYSEEEILGVLNANEERKGELDNYLAAQLRNADTREVIELKIKEVLKKYPELADLLVATQQALSTPSSDMDSNRVDEETEPLELDFMEETDSQVDTDPLAGLQDPGNEREEPVDLAALDGDIEDALAKKEDASSTQDSLNHQASSAA